MTPHIEAKKGDYADVVLMPGDPLRAKWVAETFLAEPKLVNRVRNCLGYTGTWRGRRVSVQASGMGQPSLAIYVHELLTVYEVKSLIRIGTSRCDSRRTASRMVSPTRSGSVRPTESCGADR